MLLSGILLAACTLLLTSGHAVYAHGGVIVDSGFTGEYEWLVATSPFPVTTDAAVLTLLVYDAESFEPVNNLDVTLYLIAPGESTPCCDPQVHLGPIAMISEPEIYPGDYSEIITLDEVGEWGVGFVVEAAQSAPIQIETALNVRQGSGSAVGPSLNPPADMPPSSDPASAADASAGMIEQAGTPNVAATATAFARNVETARAQLGASEVDTAAAAGVPVQSSNIFTGERWWLWVVAGVIALVAVVALALRPVDDDEQEPDSAR